MRAFFIETYRPHGSPVAATLPVRLVVYRVKVADEVLVWDKVGVQKYPASYFILTRAMVNRQRRELGRYCREYHPGFPVFRAGVSHRHLSRVTAPQAKKMTGVDHPMGAVDRLRELVEEGIDNGTLTGTFRAGC